MSFNGWMLPDTERARVLAHFHAHHENVKATHVTLSIDEDNLPIDAKIVIIGRVDDGGVEALVCSVNGETKRPDGLIYHLTLSLADGRSSKESNDIIALLGWDDVLPFPIRTKAFLSRGDSYMTSPLTGLEDD